MEAWTLRSESVLPTGRKTRALLALVALAAPRPMLRSRVAETLWSRRPEEYARASLRQEIHRLHEALGPLGPEVLAIGRDHLALRPGTVWIDVDEVVGATPARPTGLALFDGELLEDLDDVDPSFDTWLAGERERLRDRARTLGEVLLREQTELPEIVLHAQQLLAIDRTHEGAWRALMRAYSAMNERGLAIQAYERCRSVLADQLDARPSAETLRLLNDLRTADPRAHPSELTDSSPWQPPIHTPAPVATPPPDAPATRLDNATAELEREAEEVGLQRHRTDPPRRPQGGRGGVRVGVLPMQMVSTLPDEAHLAGGLAEEITAALARFRWMILVSSGTLARFAARSRDEIVIREAFGLDVMLDGTVQRADGRLRISLRLLDLRAGSQVVWSGRFDRPAQDLLALQDQIAAEVVAQIDAEILYIETTRATDQPHSDGSAYDLVLRALPLIHRLDRTAFAQGGEWLAQAIALEPDHAAGHAWYAWWHVVKMAQAWCDDEAACVAEAGQLADRAVMLDPQDAKALAVAGHVRTTLLRRLPEGMALLERALTLNPNLAMAWNLSGFGALYLGDHAEAERRIARYKQLSPLDPQAFLFDDARTLIALLRHQHEEAAAIGREVSDMNPAYSASLKSYLAALGHLGETRDAAAARTRLLVMEPTFTIQRFLAQTPLSQPRDRAHVADGLRRAGISP